MSDVFELQISRRLNATRQQVWQAWSNPAHLAEWWCPKPWTTEVKAFDFRPGGAFHTIMRGPDGGISDNPGCFLLIVPEECIIGTSALLDGWRPAHNPWMPMTSIITLADESAGTRYTARVLHPDAATRDRHEQMGFHVGWNICIDQLDAYAQTLPTG